jgi:hypothetical protein
MGQSYFRFADFDCVSIALPRHIQQMPSFGMGHPQGLFVAQCYHRFHAHRGARWNESGSERHQDQQNGGAHVRPRIVGAYLEEQALEQAACTQRGA